MHISIAAEPLFLFLGVPISNSFLASLIVSLLLIIFSVVIYFKVKAAKFPSKLQIFTEMILETLETFLKEVAGDKSRDFFPLIATFFIYILCLNWFGLLPGVGSIGFTEISHGKEIFVPILRGGTADLNITLAFALFSVAFIQIYGLKYQGINYLKKFFDFSNPINFAVGILEIFSELSKIISFSFRLFGNIFAGEVLLTVMIFLVPVIIPAVFLGLEVFVGLIQAFIFMMLTLVFISGATEGHGEKHNEQNSEHKEAKELLIT